MVIDNELDKLTAKVLNNIPEIVDEKILEQIKEEKETFTINMDDVEYGDEYGDVSYKKVINRVIDHLTENYFDKQDFKDLKLDINNKYEGFNWIIKGTNEAIIYQKKEEIRQRKEEKDRQLNALLNEINNKIDQKKLKGFKGNFDCKKGSSEEYYYDLIVESRDDFINVNTGQYKIIYDKPKTKKETKNIPINNNKTDYKISFKNPFYTKEVDFFDKKDCSIENFLNNSYKVGLSSDMILIPFFALDTYYYITIDNLTEQITIDTVKTAFKHINPQSNIYHQVRKAITKELRDDYEEFEHHLLIDLRTATGKNNKLLNRIFKQPNILLNSKYIYKCSTALE